MAATGDAAKTPYFDLPSWRDEVLPFFTRFNLKRLASLVAVAMSLYHLVTGYIGEPVPEFHRPAHLMFALAVLFLDRDRPAESRVGRMWMFVWDWALIAFLVASCAYLFFSVDYIQTRMQFITPLSDIEMIFSTALFAIVLEAARRTTGWTLVIVVLTFLAFALWGNYLPTPFWHSGKTLEQVMDLMYLTNLGMFGSPLGVTASYIFHFVFFGALLVASGAGSFFTDAANAITGRYVGGAAKTAVISSAFMASVSGTAAGNVATTGSFTIPAMKKAGYSPVFAGAVEAVASSGGLMTPPVLGATAFVMAEMTGITYSEIIVAAILPAVLYYVGTFVTVDLEARKLNLAPMAAADIPRLWTVVRRRGYLVLPLITLIWFIVEGYTLVHAAIWSIIALVALLFVLDSDNRRRFVRVIWTAMTNAPRMMGQITVAVTIGGILVGIIVQTGIGVRLSAIILELAGGELFNVLLLTMFFSILLGMGMPATGAYIILALLLAPGMVQLGVPLLAAHMFIFYGGCKSNITPPVAIAAFAAAAIAGTGPMATAMKSFVIGLPIYILPFMFVYAPELLGIGGFGFDSAWRFITAALGIAAISVACVGWLFRPLGWPERIAWFITAGVFVFPGAVTDAIAFGLFALLGTAAYLRRPRTTATAA